MAIPVLILGQSGTGKSYSLKEFGEDEILLISVQKSLLPFRKKFTSTVVTDKYDAIKSAMRSCKKRVIVIDDTQYLMANEFMRRSSEKGYDKFTEIAYNFWQLIVQEVNALPDDTIVYLLCHTATDESGVEKMKTIGKLVDEKITPEGLFTIVLKTTVSDGNYAFVTQNNGHDTVKSPEGMFESYAIKNDLKYVDDKIRNYYMMSGAISDEEMAAHDVEAVSDVQPKTREKRERKSRAAEVETTVRPITIEKPNGEVVDVPAGTPMDDKFKDDIKGAKVAPMKERKKREVPDEIVNAGVADGVDEVPFKADETPAEAPRRRRRRTE